MRSAAKVLCAPRCTTNSIWGKTVATQDRRNVSIDAIRAQGSIIATAGRDEELKIIAFQRKDSSTTVLLIFSACKQSWDRGRLSRPDQPNGLSARGTPQGRPPH